MERLIQFIKKIYFFLLFVIFEIVAYNLYASTSLYNSAVVHNVTNEMFNGMYSLKNSISDFFALKEMNVNLLKENAKLRGRVSSLEDVSLRMLNGERIEALSLEKEGLGLNPETGEVIGLKNVIFEVSTEDASGGENIVKNVTFDEYLDIMGANFGRADSLMIDSMLLMVPDIATDEYIYARVVNNTISRQKNFLTLNRGKFDGVEVNQPVVFKDDIVGYVVAVSNNYSVVMSILNTSFKTSGMLKKDGSMCSVFWKGGSDDELEFSGISAYSPINVGDTIVTTGFSQFFTPDKNIGVVKEFSLNEGVYYNGKLKILAPMTKLRYVNIIKPNRLNERLELEEETIK